MIELYSVEGTTLVTTDLAEARLVAQSEGRKLVVKRYVVADEELLEDYTPEQKARVA